MKSFKTRAANIIPWQAAADTAPESDPQVKSAPTPQPKVANPAATQTPQTSSTRQSSGAISLRAKPKTSRLQFTAKHDRRVLLMSLASGFPAVLVGLILLWIESYPARVQWTLTVVIVGFWLGFARGARARRVSAADSFQSSRRAARG